MPNVVLARKSLEQRLAKLRHAPGLARPPTGWIRAIREALGMTTTQFSKRMGLSQPRASRLQQDEIEDVVTLRTLREAAEALDCALVYALVPNRPLDDIIAARAGLLAEDAIKRISHTMALEDQALSKEQLRSEHARLVKNLLDGPPKRLWDEP
jgi:predicted DNA-binding mobile mystery protein A